MLDDLIPWDKLFDFNPALQARFNEDRKKRLAKEAKLAASLKRKWEKEKHLSLYDQRAGAIRKMKSQMRQHDRGRA